MINRRDLLVSAAASAILPVSGLPAAAQGLARTSFGPTTVDISTGHAGHSSLPTALGYWKDEGLDVNVFGVAGETAGVQLLRNQDRLHQPGRHRPALGARQGHSAQGGLHACPHA